MKIEQVTHGLSAHMLIRSEDLSNFEVAPEMCHEGKRQGACEQVATRRRALSCPPPALIHVLLLQLIKFEKHLQVLHFNAQIFSSKTLKKNVIRSVVNPL